MSQTSLLFLHFATLKIRKHTRHVAPDCGVCACVRARVQCWRRGCLYTDFLLSSRPALPQRLVCSLVFTSPSPFESGRVSLSTIFKFMFYVLRVRACELCRSPLPPPTTTTPPPSTPWNETCKSPNTHRPIFVSLLQWDPLTRWSATQSLQRAM